MEIQDGRYFCKIVLVDTFNLICYLPCFLSVITKRDNFRTRSSDDEGTLTKRHFSQLLPGHQTATLVIMFTKWPLMKDLKRNFAYTPRTQNPPQALDYNAIPPPLPRYHITMSDQPRAGISKRTRYLINTDLGCSGKIREPLPLTM